LKNDILTDLKQISYDYEKLREENPKIRKTETLVNYSLIPISAVFTSLVYNHLNNVFPISQPTGEEIMDVIINGARYGWASPGGGGGGSITYKVETREEAIRYLIDSQKNIRAIGYGMCVEFVPIGLILLLLSGVNPGEKVLKCPYTLGKTLRNGMGRLKSYLKGMQELKQKRKEVNYNER
jgi:hypothetical protein